MEESQKTKEVYDFFEKKFGLPVCLVACFKLLSIISAKLSYPRLSIAHEARSREWKSRSSLEVIRFFAPTFYRNMMGELTIHAIVRDWGTNLNKIAVLVNDGTLLFSSLAARTKMRWMGAFSALLTEGRYIYADNFTHFTIKGKISLIINIATPSWNRYKWQFIDTTLGNRLLLVHAWMTENERYETKIRYEKTEGLKPPFKIEKIRNRTIKNLPEYSEKIRHIANDYSALAVRAPDELYDLLIGAIKANCALNDRNHVTDDEIYVIKLLKDFMKDPLVPDHPRVIELLRQERSFSDISRLLGKPLSYKSTISKIRKEAKMKGVID